MLSISGREVENPPFFHFFALAMVLCTYGQSFLEPAQRRVFSLCNWNQGSHGHSVGNTLHSAYSHQEADPSSLGGDQLPWWSHRRQQAWKNWDTYSSSGFITTGARAQIWTFSVLDLVYFFSVWGEKEVQYFGSCMYSIYIYSRRLWEGVDVITIHYLDFSPSDGECYLSRLQCP